MNWTLIILVLAAYLIGARWPGLARSVGIA